MTIKYIFISPRQGKNWYSDSTACGNLQPDWFKWHWPLVNECDITVQSWCGHNGIAFRWYTAWINPVQPHWRRLIYLKEEISVLHNHFSTISPQNRSRSFKYIRESAIYDIPFWQCLWIANAHTGITSQVINDYVPKKASAPRSIQVSKNVAYVKCR